MIDQELVDILVCPDTKKPLRIADQYVVDQINNLIELKIIKNKLNQVVEDKLQGGLIVVDGEYIYPIREDIPILLPDESISLDQIKDK